MGPPERTCQGPGATVPGPPSLVATRGRLDRAPSQQRGRDRVNHALWLRPGEDALVEEAARITGQSILGVLRLGAVELALRIVLAARNRPVRARTGAILWAVVAGGTFKPAGVMKGTERIYVVDRTDGLPSFVHPASVGWIVDVVSEGAGFILGLDEIAWGGPEATTWPPTAEAVRRTDPDPSPSSSGPGKPP